MASNSSTKKTSQDTTAPQEEARNIVTVFPNGSDLNGALLTFNVDDTFSQFLQRASRKLWGNDNGRRLFEFSGHEIQDMSFLAQTSTVFLSQGEDYRHLAWGKQQEEALQQKRFACPYPDCMKTFGRKYDLDVHFRRHTKEKPYKCSFPGCHKCFVRISTLHVHERTIHNMQIKSTPHTGSEKAEVQEVDAQAYVRPPKKQKPSQSSRRSSKHQKTEPAKDLVSEQLLKPNTQEPQTPVVISETVSPSLAFLSSNSSPPTEDVLNAASEVYQTLFGSEQAPEAPAELQMPTKPSCCGGSSLEQQDLSALFGDITPTHKPGCLHTQITHNGQTDFIYNNFLFPMQEDCTKEDLHHSLEESVFYPNICAPFYSTTHDHTHIHGPNCGHIPIQHGNHIDYMVDGYLHHMHNGHCDNHGMLKVETTSCAQCPNCRAPSSPLSSWMGADAKKWN